MSKYSDSLREALEKDKDLPEAVQAAALKQILKEETPKK